MADIEEQTEPFLKSNSPRSNERPLSIWQRLRRFVRQCIVFVLFYLIQVYEFFRNDDNNNYQPHRQQVVTTTEMAHIKTPQTLIDNIETESEMENNGQDPLDDLTSGENNDVGGLDGGLLPDSTIRIIQIDSPVTGPIIMVTTDAQTTPVLSPSYSNPSPQRSSFHTDNPMPVAFSYAGETEDRVREISRHIQNAVSTPNSPPPVFFAPDFQDELSQLNGMDILQKVYRHAALVVVFLSNAYPDSRFCHGEWRTIADRFCTGQQHQEQRKRLVLVKLGDYNSDALGLVANDFYIDGTKKNDKEVADIIISRFRKIENLPIQ